MLSSVLNSDRAIKMNIAIMRAFVRLRELLATNKALGVRIEKLEAGQRGEIEIPSDFEGVVYIAFDNSDGWKLAVGPRTGRSRN